MFTNGSRVNSESIFGLIRLINLDKLKDFETSSITSVIIYICLKINL
jgi:hypothetical protein